MGLSVTKETFLFLHHPKDDTVSRIVTQICLVLLMTCLTCFNTRDLTGLQPSVNWYVCRLAARQEILKLVKKSIWNNSKLYFSWRIITAYFDLFVSSLVRSAFLEGKNIKQHGYIGNGSNWKKPSETQALFKRVNTLHTAYIMLIV